VTDRPQTQLTTRLDRLADVLDIAEGVVDAATERRAAAVIDNASHRLRHGTNVTVVALAGATGSGKSTLFNQIVGEEIAPTGVMRPTTSEARAAVFGPETAESLLDWLGIRHRHGVDGGRLDGLVLIDLPDHDSVEVTHRMQVDRFVELVDTLIWVLDPQKYADQVLHERYIAALSHHGDVMVFLLHQIDLIPVEQRAELRDDAIKLLAADGLDDSTLVETSAVNGEGVAELEALLVQRIETRRTALDRIDADLQRIAAELDSLRLPAIAGPSVRQRQRLIAGLAEAAGAPGVADVVGEAYRHRAGLRTGWPFTRWIGKLRRNPLGNLAGTDAVGRPTAAPIDEARLDLALKTAADDAAGDLPPAWLRKIRLAAGLRRGELTEAMSSGVTAVVGLETSNAKWWGFAAFVQRLFAFIAIAGALWILGLWALEWLRVPTDTVTPEYRGWPVPTLLLIGGVVVGLVLSWVVGLVAAVGSRRRARRVRGQIEHQLESAADDLVLDSVRHELERIARLGADLDMVAGMS